MQWDGCRIIRISGILHPNTMWSRRDFRQWARQSPSVQCWDSPEYPEPTRSDLPDSVDLRQWCSPIEDQGKIGSCTAHAGVSIVEYFERRAFGNHLDASRLFLYKTTRNLLHYTGDTGAFIRSAMAALALFGVPPEEYWPYNPADFDKEPPGFCYALARNYQAISYYRLDVPGTSRDALLAAIKKNLAAGIPAMFGFTVYSSYMQSAKTGKIPFPAPNEKIVGGHAIAAMGYDDSVSIRNTGSNARKRKEPCLSEIHGVPGGEWTATDGFPMNTS